MTDRAAAVTSLRGLALGDAFGETWFFQPADVPAAKLAQRRLPPAPWRWTDDTAMALSLLKVLHEHGTVDQDALAAEFARGYAADPDRGYGASMSTVLSAIGDGADWAEVTGRQFGGRGSWGNGAAMRVAPLGAWFAADLDRVAVEAVRSAVVTHAHPEAAAGAVAVAVAAALSARGIAGPDLLAAVTDRVPDGEVAARLRRAREVPRTDDPRAAAAVLGCGHRVAAVDTVPYAVWCAARHLNDPAEALWATVLAGGDTDTTCAIVGGVVAAGAGLDRIPVDWLAACEPLPEWVDRVAA